MPLYLQNGKLLQKAGALGTSAGCCCSSGCNCSGGPIEIPSTVTVEYSLGDFVSQAFNGTCTHDDAVAFIEGTYVLSPSAINSDYVIYALTAESGAVVSLKWFCNLGISGQTATFTFASCDASSQCFARTDQTFFIYSGDLLGLCAYPQNNVDTNTWDSGGAFVFLEQGPLIFGCDQSKGLTGRNYYFSLAITAAW